MDYKEKIIEMVNQIEDTWIVEQIHKIISLIRQLHNKELLKRIYNLTEYLFVYKDADEAVPDSVDYLTGRECDLGSGIDLQVK